MKMGTIKTGHGMSLQVGCIEPVQMRLRHPREAQACTISHVNQGQNSLQVMLQGL